MSDYPALREFIATKLADNLPGDARYVNTKRDRQCWNNYADFFRCVAVREEKGKDTIPCEYFRAQVAQVCPAKWTAEWDEQRAAGCFPANKYSLEPATVFPEDE